MDNCSFHMLCYVAWSKKNICHRWCTPQLIGKYPLLAKKKQMAKKEHCNSDAMFDTVNGVAALYGGMICTLSYFSLILRKQQWGEWKVAQKMCQFQHAYTHTINIRMKWISLITTWVHLLHYSRKKVVLGVVINDFETALVASRKITLQFVYDSDCKDLAVHWKITIAYF